MAGECLTLVDAHVAKATLHSTSHLKTMCGIQFRILFSNPLPVGTGDSRPDHAGE